jgi:hypothetical protein
MFLIANFRRVLNVVLFLLRYSPASEFYMPTFRNTSIFKGGVSRKILPAYTADEDGTECSETWPYKIQEPGNHPKEKIQRRI